VPGLSDGSVYRLYTDAAATQPNRCSETRLWSLEDDNADTDISGEWVCIEMWVNGTAGNHGVKIWTQDGRFNGDAFQTSASYANTAFVGIGYYYNTFHTGDVTATAAKMYVDDVIIRNDNTEIGPPAGFIEGEATPSTFSGVGVSWQ